MRHLPNLRRYGLFDAKVPRFTSYPPANHFSSNVTFEDVARWQNETPQNSEISVYVHIPFCKRLCWFCACRTQGTKSKAPLKQYIDRVLQEARNARSQLPSQIKLRRLHLGGGTPTILPSDLLEQLLEGLKALFDAKELEEFSVEIDPTDVGPKRLAVLIRHGLNRASLGIQDFAPKVQSAIGREQSLERTRDVLDMIRDSGVDRINFDLLYGLPHQTRESLLDTLTAVSDMAPDRIALFGYAHVPWMSKRQVMIPISALPNAETRFALFETARLRLLGEGFLQIGIDHFAKSHDSLAHAYVNKTLHRSFQGYTDDPCIRLIALGASAISTYPQGFAQNLAVTGQYAKAIDAGLSPVWRGYALSYEDRAVSDFIEQLMCYHTARAPESASSLLTKRVRAVAQRYPDALDWDGHRLRLANWAYPLARIIGAQIALGEPERQAPLQYSSAI